MKFFIMPLMVVLLASLVAAHLDGGQDVEIGPYLVDIGYSPAALEAHQRSTFSIALFNATSSDPLRYDKTWVRLTEENDVVFSGTLIQEFDASSFTILLPQPGEYELTVRFISDDTIVVETSVPLDVSGSLIEHDLTTTKGEEVSLLGKALVILSAFLLGALLIHHMQRRRKHGTKK